MSKPVGSDRVPRGTQEWFSTLFSFVSSRDLADLDTNRKTALVNISRQSLEANGSSAKKIHPLTLSNTQHHVLTDGSLIAAAAGVGRHR